MVFIRLLIFIKICFLDIIEVKEFQILLFQKYIIIL